MIEQDTKDEVNGGERSGLRVASEQGVAEERMNLTFIMMGPKLGRTTPYPIAVINNMKNESEFLAEPRTATRRRKPFAPSGCPDPLRYEK